MTKAGVKSQLDVKVGAKTQQPQPNKNIHAYKYNQRDDELDLVSSLSSTIDLDLDHHKTTKKIKMNIKKGYESAYQSPMASSIKETKSKTSPLKNELFQSSRALLSKIMEKLVQDEYGVVVLHLQPLINEGEQHNAVTSINH